MTVPKPCIECGEVTPSTTRCNDCEAARNARRDVRRGTAAQRGYDRAWDRLSAQARALQPFCSTPGCSFPITPTHPLTAHHLVWPALKLADVQVLCLTCNNRRGKTPREP